MRMHWRVFEAVRSASSFHSRFTLIPTDERRWRMSPSTARARRAGRDASQRAGPQRTSYPSVSATGLHHYSDAAFPAASRQRPWRWRVRLAPDSRLSLVADEARPAISMRRLANKIVDLLFTKHAELRA